MKPTRLDVLIPAALTMLRKRLARVEREIARWEKKK